MHPGEIWAKSPKSGILGRSGQNPPERFTLIGEDCEGILGRSGQNSPERFTLPGEECEGIPVEIW